MSPLTVEGVYKVHMVITILVLFHTFFTVMMTASVCPNFAKKFFQFQVKNLGAS